MDSNTTGLWIMLLVIGAICGIVGYYLGRIKFKAADNSEELLMLKNKNLRLQTELDACNTKLANAALDEHQSVTAISETSSTTLETASAAFPFKPAKAKAAFGKRVKEDDLKIVEGIGPKIEQLFHSSGINTWKSLSEVSVSKCQEILDAAGDRYRIHDPSSWPMQAKMAYQGKWKVLVKWQDDHKAGKF